MPLLFALACHKTPDPVESPVPPAPDASASRDAMVRALSSRDGAPPCEAVEALSSEPVTDLVWIVEHVGMPPAAPMIAATCLLDRHPAEAAAPFEGWLATDGHGGLAELVVQRLDALPLEVAVRLASVGLRGPYDDVVRPAVAASARPELRAELVMFEEPPPPPGTILE